MNRKILLFGFSGEEGLRSASSLRRKVRPMNIRVERIEPGDYLKPIGELAGVGMPGIPALRHFPGMPEGEYHGSELPVRVVVMSGLTDEQLDLLLKIYPECGITKEDLKAVLTPSNASWSAVGLCGELQKEHLKIRSSFD